MTTVPFHKREPKPAPAGLGDVGLTIWRSLTTERVFDDVAGLSGLASYCKVHDDLAEARAIVARDGLQVQDRFGQWKAHSMLREIRGLEQLKRQLARSLGLEPEPEKKPIGRPAFSPSKNRS